MEVVKSIELTEKQQQFFDAAMAGESLLLEGKAGTGKTTITQMVIDSLLESGKNVVVVAPTGVAANNIKGQTIHSLFALPVGPVITFEACRFVRNDKRKLFNLIDVLIVDEISMCRADMIDGIHWTMKKNKSKGLDKIQVIFVGDLKQLPAIARGNDRSDLHDIYGGIEFYRSEVFLKHVKFKKIDLDVVKRQSDEDFVQHLNIIREGGKSDYFKRFHGTQVKGVVLAPHRTTVDRYNEEGLAKLEGEEIVFEAELEGKVKITDFNLEQTVKVKDGAKVMFLLNDKTNGLFNGRLGIFRVIEGLYYIEVGEETIHITRATVKKTEYVVGDHGKIRAVTIGSIKQIPIRLAYAVTIHKCQGISLPECTIDLSRPVFESGMLYVALSRVISPEGLSIVTGNRKLKKP